MISEMFPILTTADLGRALSFYRDLLGGTVTYEFEGPDGEPGYVGLDLGSSHIGIGRDPSLQLPRGRRAMSLWVYADDCDVAIHRMREAGVTIVDEPADQPWGERIARVADPDGNEVIVGARGVPPATTAGSLPGTHADEER
jgi:lactoylglutathione lyase